MNYSKNYKPFLGALMICPILAAINPDALMIVTFAALSLISGVLCLWRMLGRIKDARRGKTPLAVLAGSIVIFLLLPLVSGLLNKTLFAELVLPLGLGSFLLIWGLGIGAIIFDRVDEE